MNPMPATNDDMMFADDTDDGSPEASIGAWKIMIVDDEEAIHNVTELALMDFRFGDKGLEFLHAHSGAEAKTMISEHPDTAVMLLDVVMEDDHAGLDVARFIREDADNKSVRIVLRTGQPGQAPERDVITSYDINDYKEKTELTSQKLFTLMYSSLRSYRDIIALDNNKRGLEEVISASANIFELKNMNHFTNGVLDQLTALMHLDREAVYCKAEGLAACHDKEKFEIIAATGSYENLVGTDVHDSLSPEILQDLNTASEARKNIYLDDRFMGFFQTNSGTENLVYLSGLGRQISDMDRSLLELFIRNASIAYQNIELHLDVENTQREIVYMLGEAVETRSKETGNHVKRVAEISRILGLACGIEEQEAEVLKLASPMHDVGKIGIPDAILNKPGRHTEEEFEIMKTHSILGYDMLKGSERKILRAGAVIARDHHEKWSGAGYPDGRKGEDIHLYGRIVAVADVFDALGSDRCYKEAWPLDKIIDLMNEESGNHFEPKLVDALLSNMDKITAIRDQYADTF